MNAYELDITDFFKNAAAADYSASRAEYGENAARITWSNALRAEWQLLKTNEQREAFRGFVRSSGGWSAEEIAAWDDKELNALCVQWVSGDIREVPGVSEGDWTDEEWKIYEECAQCGAVSSRLYRADDGAVYFYIGE